MHSRKIFPRSIWSSIPLKKRIWIYQLRTFLAVFPTIFLALILPCNGSEQKPETLKQLIEMYDPAGCQECHEEIYAQWQNSHHARSITGIFMARYLKKGPLSVRRPKEATRKNFPCFKCHLPQLEKATDAVAAEIAAVILNNDQTTMQKLNSVFTAPNSQ